MSDTPLESLGALGSVSLLGIPLDAWLAPAQNKVYLCLYSKLDRNVSLKLVGKDVTQQAMARTPETIIISLNMPDAYIKEVLVNLVTFANDFWTLRAPNGNRDQNE